MALDAYAWLNRVAEIAAPVFPPGPATAPAPTVEPAPTPQQGQAPVGAAHYSTDSNIRHDIPGHLPAGPVATYAQETAQAGRAGAVEGDLVDHTWPERHAAMEQFFARHPQIIQKPALS